MRQTVLIPCILMLCAAMRAPGGTPSVTPGQMVTWTIVCDARATPAERTAATEFQTLYRGLTGRTLRIAARPSRGGSIFIGPDAVRRAGRRMPSAALGEEGLRIRVDRDAVCIDGGRPRGTLYGVHEFFEELCGVRYLTFDHTYFPPRAASAPIPVGSRAYVPQFAFRWSYYGENSRRPAFAARLHTNTVSADPALGGKTGYQLVNHNVASLAPPAKYGRAHPEYYALVGGKRVWDTTDGGGPQLCLTNPHVRDIVVRAVEDQIRRNPAQRNFPIAQMDNGNYCTCPQCKAIDTREGAHSGSMIAFVNAVAERVEKRYPKAIIGTFAYWYTRKPPRTLQPRRNVMVQLCSIECCDLHPIDDPTCALNREFCRDMAVWNRKCNRIFVWHYNTNFSCYMLPFPNLRAIGGSVKYFADHSGRGVFMQAAGNGFSTEMSDLRNYVISRCLWKPGRNSWREAMEFCRLHYAESSGPMMAYLKYYHDMVQARRLHPPCFPTEAGLGITPETARRIFAYFRQAAGLARSNAVRARVEKASLCAYRAALGASGMRFQLRDGMLGPDLTGLEPNLLDRYAALCSRYGATMENEGMATGAYLNSLRGFYGGLPAEVIQNDRWRVVLVPGSGARTVEMTYLPTGRNIVQPSRGFNRFRHEEWVKSGAGPSAASVAAFEVVGRAPDRIVLAHTASDGTRFERTVALQGDAVRFDTTITARVERPLDIWVHPEYDAASTDADAGTVRIYVKAPDWVQINRNWPSAHPTPEQEAALRQAASGGGYAYYNTRARFGVEQRFAPAEIGGLGAFWEPSRQQVNLELLPAVRSLAAGASAHYGYEVRYLASPPGAASPASGRP